MNRYVTSLVFGAGLAAVVTSARAGEALPQDMSDRLDKAPIAFAMSEAKRERLMIIQENMARQRQYGRGGYDRGYGYGPRYGGAPRLNPDPSIFYCDGVPCGPRRRW